MPSLLATSRWLSFSNLSFKGIWICVPAALVRGIPRHQPAFGWPLTQPHCLNQAVPFRFLFPVAARGASTAFTDKLFFFFFKRTPAWVIFKVVQEQRVPCSLLDSSLSGTKCRVEGSSKCGAVEGRWGETQGAQGSKDASNRDQDRVALSSCSEHGCFF